MKSGPAFVIALGLALVISASAAAQNNQPYVPGFGRPGAGVGMSAAAREAVLNKELFNRTPGELVRGPNGLLLDVRERDNNAFLQVPGGGNLLPGARPGRGWPTGLGTGLGWNNAGFSDNGGSYGLISLGRSRSLNSWIALLPAGIDDTGGGGFSAGGTPIDTWISQLNQL